MWCRVEPRHRRSRIAKTQSGYKEDGLSNAQCEQLNHPDSDHQYRERDGIVIEPIFPVCTHDMPPLYALPLVGAGRQMVQIGRTIFPGGYSALNPCPSFRPSEPGFGRRARAGIQ
jgi:hypothetical protein